MTDKQKLIELLFSFGVAYKSDGNDIVCHEGDEKVTGYGCFYTRFEFDENGKFIKLGAWE